eukprot:9472608-Pyramimonas_sp.AAC.2
MPSGDTVVAVEYSRWDAEAYSQTHNEVRPATSTYEPPTGWLGDRLDTDTVRSIVTTLLSHCDKSVFLGGDP